GGAQRPLRVIGQTQRWAVRVRVGQGGAELPEQLPTGDIGPVKRTNRDEPLHDLFAESRTGHEVANAAVRTDCSLLVEEVLAGLVDPPDLACPQAHGVVATGIARVADALRAVFPGRGVDVDW